MNRFSKVHGALPGRESWQVDSVLGGVRPHAPHNLSEVDDDNPVVAHGAAVALRLQNGQRKVG